MTSYLRLNDVTYQLMTGISLFFILVSKFVILMGWRKDQDEAGVTTVRPLVYKNKCVFSELKVVFLPNASKSLYCESLHAQSAASRQLIGIRGTVLHVHLLTLRTRRRCRAESPEFLCSTPPGAENDTRWSGFMKTHIHTNSCSHMKT